MLKGVEIVKGAERTHIRAPLALAAHNYAACERSGNMLKYTFPSGLKYEITRLPDGSLDGTYFEPDGRSGSMADYAHLFVSLYNGERIAVSPNRYAWVDIIVRENAHREGVNVDISDAHEFEFEDEEPWWYAY